MSTLNSTTLNTLRVTLNILLKQREKNLDPLLLAFQFNKYFLKEFQKENYGAKDLDLLSEVVLQTGDLLKALLCPKEVGVSNQRLEEEIHLMKSDKDKKRFVDTIENIFKFKLSLENDLEKILEREEVGGKSADLIELQNILQDIKSDVDQQRLGLVKNIAIPEFTAISNNSIREWLQNLEYEKSENGESVTYLEKLNKLWKEFIELSEKQNGENLTGDSKNKLQEIQEFFVKTFTENEFPLDKDFAACVMVRSSTNNEDDPEHSQAGFYNSFPSENEQHKISARIGEVLSSYFNPEIFMIRIKQGEDVKKMPGLSCLVQELIQEDENSIPFSGVLYVTEYGTRIYFASGHGEAVVGSYPAIKASTAFVTENGNVFCEFNKQDFRFVPVIKAGEGGRSKLELVKKENDFNQKVNDHLPEEVLAKIARVSEDIRKERKMDMDIEFAVKKDPNSGEYDLYLLQNRALTHEKNKQNPSTIDPIYLSTNNNWQEIRGKLVTSSILTVVKINNPKEIIICNTTAEADAKYIDASNKGKIIKAVIVKEPAAEGDHFVNNFISRNIPIIQIDGERFDEIQSWVSPLNIAGNGFLVFDPQFQRIIKTNDKDVLIVKGLFKSGLSTKVSIEKDQDKTEDEWGRVVLKVLEELFPAESKENTGSKKITPEDIRNALDKLSFPSQSSVEQNESFKEILQIISQSKRQEKISLKLYQKIALTVAELWTIKKRIDNPDFNNNIDKDLDILKYLNVYQKLNGLFLNQENLVDSFVSELKEAKRHWDVTLDGVGQEYEIPEEVNDEKQKEYYKELVTMARLIARDDGRKEWVSFCKNVCINKDGKELASLMAHLIKYNLHQYWINTEFLSGFSEAKDGNRNITYLELLDKLKIEFLDEEKSKRTRALVEINKRLGGLELMISDFSDPKKFDTNFARFQSVINELDKIFLKQNKNETNLNLKLSIDLQLRMIDIYDKAIKALQISSQYDESYVQKQQKVRNFELMIEYFVQIFSRRAEDNEKEKVKLGLIKDKLKNLEGKLKVLFGKGLFNSVDKHLMVSADLTLLSMLSNDETEFKKGVITIQTLADIHTIIHQRIINIININQRDLLGSIEKNLPEEVKNFQKIANDVINDKSVDININLVSIKFYDNLVKLSYNVPLREHSAAIDVKYNLEEKSFFVKMICSGMGVYGEEKRWNNLSFYFLNRVLDNSALETDILDCKADRESYELQLKFNEECGEDILKIIKSYLIQTLIYNDSYGYKHSSETGTKLSEGFVAALQNNLENEINNWNRKWFLHDRSKVILEIDHFDIEDDEKKNFIKNSYNALVFVKNGILTQDIINKSDLRKLQLLCSNGVFYLIAKNGLDLALGVKSIDNLNDNHLKVVRSLCVAQMLLGGSKTYEELQDDEIRKKEIIKKSSSATLINSGYASDGYGEVLSFVEKLDLGNDRESEVFYILIENLDEMKVINKTGKITLNNLIDIYNYDGIEKFENFVKNARNIKSLLCDKITFDDLKNLYDQDINKFEMFTKNGSGLVDMVRLGVDFDDLKNLYDQDKDKFKIFAENGSSVASFINLGAPFDSLKKFYDQNKDKFEIFLKNADVVVSFANFGVTFDDLKNLYDQDINKFEILVKNTFSLERLLAAKSFTFDDLKNLYDQDLKKFEMFAKNGVGIAKLLNVDVITLDELKNLYDQDLNKFEMFAKNGVDLASLINLGVDFDDLKNLYDQNKDKFEMLVVYGRAARLIRIGGTFDDLKDLYDKDRGKFEILIKNTFHIDMLFSSGKVTFDDIKNLYDQDDNDKFEMLIKNKNVKKIISNDNILFKDLIDMDKSKLEVLLDDANSEISKEILKDLKDMDTNKIKSNDIDILNSYSKSHNNAPRTVIITEGATQMNNRRRRDSSNSDSSSEPTNLLS